MMTVFDLLDRLEPLRGMPAVLIILVMAYLAVALPELRLVVPALGLHYVAAGLLYVDILDPRLAFAYVLAGVVVSLIMGVTAGQINWGRPPRGMLPEEAAAAGWSPPTRVGPLQMSGRALLRAGLAMVGLLVAFLVAPQFTEAIPVIPPEQSHVIAAVVGLGLIGLVGLATSTAPFQSAVGLLLFLTGFSLYYSAFDPSIGMVAALIILQLVVSLAAAYLAQTSFYDWPAKEAG